MIGIGCSRFTVPTEIKKIYHSTNNNQVMNALAQLLNEMDNDDAVVASVPAEDYDRGMFISINNHKQDAGDLYLTLKKQYQSMMKVLIGHNLSKSSIKVTDKLPTNDKLMRTLNNKNIVVAAGIHYYDRFDNRTFRGSHYNYGQYQHLHFYVYGVHQHLKHHRNGVDGAVEHMKHLLYRNNRFSNKQDASNIDIRQVGKGKYIYNDVVAANTLYEYLMLPITNPAKDCVINYIAGAGSEDIPANPIFYIYTTEKKYDNENTI